MGVLAFLALQLCTAFAAVVQSATGFGFAIVAIGPFLWLFESRAAVAVIMALTLAVSVLLLHRIGQQLDWQRLRGLLLGVAIGFYPGFLAAGAVSLTVLKVAVGCCIIVFALLIWLPATGQRHLPA